MRKAVTFIEALRPKQWAKNVFCFAALVFDQRMTDRPSLVLGLVAFAVFCALSSSVYLFNDVMDRQGDRQHPLKRFRPVASGRITIRTAIVGSLLLALVGMAGAVLADGSFAAVAAAYLLLNLAYSLWLKRVVILDVMLIASGFLLRAWAGGEIMDVVVSNWLILCTGLIALFLGFVKRRQELVALSGADRQRPTLREYSLPFLDQMIAIVTASTVVAYSLYAFSEEVAQRLGSRWMGLTIPFVLFGIFRYLYLVHRRGAGENPAALVTSDRALLATMLLWGLTAVAILYFR